MRSSLYSRMSLEDRDEWKYRFGRYQDIASQLIYPGLFLMGVFTVQLLVLVFVFYTPAPEFASVRTDFVAAARNLSAITGVLGLVFALHCVYLIGMLFIDFFRERKWLKNKGYA